MCGHFQIQPGFFNERKNFKNFYLIWQVKHEQYMAIWQETVYWIIYEFYLFFFFSSTYMHENSLLSDIGQMTQGNGLVFESLTGGLGAAPMVIK